jgi:glucose-6-phosphate isomerase
MPDLSLEPLKYDPSGVIAVGGRLFECQLEKVLGALDRCRSEALADVEIQRINAHSPPTRLPLDAAFIDLPERLLSEYRKQRAKSEIQRILDAARRMAAEVDRVVVLGIGGSYMGARALLESCCHPFWNELSRGERAGYPRIYFEGNNVDNDAMQGLLDLLVRGHGIAGGNDRWGIVAISKSGGTLETAVAVRVLLEELLRSSGAKLTQGDAPLLIPITGRDSAMQQMLRQFGCADTAAFEVPDGVGGRFSVFSAVGLVPAALLGLDIVKLLEGAAAMTEHFRSAPPEENIVLKYAAVCHLAESRLRLPIRVLSTWGKSLEAVGLWYDQLLSESLGKHERGATPLTVVNTRDLHSRGQQHQDGRRDKLITNLVVDQVRRDRLAIPRHDDARNHDKLNQHAGKPLSDILHAALVGTNQAYNLDGRPTADLHLPRCDEPAIGQLLQMLMLATVVEGRLVGTNPYGQPGVEAYKAHMKAALSP